MLTNCCAWLTVNLDACLVSVTFANAIWPEGEICALAPAPYGEATEATSGSAATLGEHRLALRPHRRIGHLAVVDRDHDLLAVARRLRRGALEQVLRLEALRAVQAEAVLVRGADALAEHRQPDQGDQPAGQHESDDA